MYCFAPYCGCMPKHAAADDSPIGSNSGALGGLLRGISCQYFATDFLQEMKEKGFERSAAVYDIEADVIRKKGEQLLCPRDERLGAAYVDALRDGDAGKSEFMLSYTWAYSVGDIADALCSFLRNLDLRSQFIWMCCLCVNQHRVWEAQALGCHVPFREFKDTFARRVAGVSHILAMMSPWKNPKYVRRVWCVFEFSVAMQEQKKLSVIMPPAEEESFRSNFFQNGLQEVYALLASLRIEDASATVEDDKINILHCIDPDAADVAQSLKVAALNTSVRRRIREWLVEQAATWLEEKISSDHKCAPLAVYNSVAGSLGTK